MIRCLSCANEVSEQSATCPRCGAPLHISGSPTLDSPRDTPARTPSRTPTPSATGTAGFAPGEVFAERYRIVGLLGRGGMGEVYRADDLKLGQPVALKFLARSFAQDAEFLSRFYAEVRLARQVSHPSVCRVYDVGETGGRHYLSMEYVDGEDLASLLTRIGRLPPDKATDIARELCAGLAAAHNKGVIHRDLKPANVMLDGRGHARITDFGLAITLEQGTAERERSGTPAYMAPEQLTGGEVTVQTDLFALGLILYEVFTGKRAFESKTLAERLRTLDTAKPASVTGIAGTDPAVERAILRCLEREPKKRPASALAVAASLPGGDPLAAALAAGETPSPEMVVAAGEAVALAPAKAWALLLSVFAGLGLVLFLARYATLTGLAPIEKSPQVLAERAQEIIGKVGYTEPPADSAYWLWANEEFLNYRARTLPAPRRVWELASAEQTGYLFTYRQSPRPMLVRTPNWYIWVSGSRVDGDEPPYDVSGMVAVLLDTRGRLIQFRAVAPQFDESKDLGAAPDWSFLFAAAALDPARFTPVQSKWWSPAPSDTLVAWEGSSSEHAETQLQVTAAAYRGKPVYFSVGGPWVTPWRMGPAKVGRAEALIIWGILGVSYVGLGAGLFFARRNLRMGRGDTRGALRLSGFVLLANVLAWTLRAHHIVHAVGEFFLFLIGASMALFQAGTFWLTYMALEPYVRRRWPEMLISWSRLLTGRVRDPLVGRDILVGTLFGAACTVILYANEALPAWFNVPGLTPVSALRLALGGPLELVSVFLTLLVTAAGITVFGPFALFLAKVTLRKQWLAVPATGALFFLSSFITSRAGLDPENLWLIVPGLLLFVVLTLFLLLRHGLLAYTTAYFVFLTLRAYPLTLDFSRWYAGASSFALLVCLGLAFYGFHTALGGQKLFQASLLEEET